MSHKPQDSNATSARRPLSTELIVRTAMELLDRRGPEGLTFRILASELNVGVASLYTHIDGKNTLLLKCLETLVTENLGRSHPSESAGARANGVPGQAPAPGQASAPGQSSMPSQLSAPSQPSGREPEHRDGLRPDPVQREPWARTLVDTMTPVFELCEQHPWLALVSEVVPVTGSDLGMPLWNRIAAVIHRLGFSDDQTFTLTATLVGHLTALMDQCMRTAYITGPMLKDANTTSVPRAFQMSSIDTLRRAGAFSRDHFDAGLQVIIDGIAAQAQRLKR